MTRTDNYILRAIQDYCRERLMVELYHRPCNGAYGEGVRDGLKSGLGAVMAIIDEEQWGLFLAQIAAKRKKMIAPLLRKSGSPQQPLHQETIA